MTAKLELHLKLDGFQVENRWHDGNGVVVTRWNLVEDSSGNNHTSALFGTADIVADDAFGACADFDGDAKSYVKVPSAQPGSLGVHYQSGNRLGPGHRQGDK